MRLKIFAMICVIIVSGLAHAQKFDGRLKELEVFNFAGHVTIEGGPVIESGNSGVNEVSFEVVKSSVTCKPSAVLNSGILTVKVEVAANAKPTECQVNTRIRLAVYLDTKILVDMEEGNITVSNVNTGGAADFHIVTGQIQVTNSSFDFFNVVVDSRAPMTLSLLDAVKIDIKSKAGSINLSILERIENGKTFISLEDGDINLNLPMKAKPPVPPLYKGAANPIADLKSGPKTIKLVKLGHPSGIGNHQIELETIKGKSTLNFK